uniref:C2H2-type domain-containing protein n=1 Tax=Ascaris lumbricoides TaxID=6252 RepID=A0A0M3I737_ASCLU
MDGRCPSVSIECSLCSLNNLITPENLCAHMRQRHSMHSAIIEHLHFDDAHTFNMWLQSVEDSRGERSGYVPRENDQENAHDNEYYLLCRRRSPVLKRRRLTSGQTRCMPKVACVPVQSVACTAFVHVIESLSGQHMYIQSSCRLQKTFPFRLKASDLFVRWVSVRYCLEHCGHSLHHSMGGTCARRCYDAACSSGSGSTFAHLKRNSSSIYNDSEDEDYASEEGVSEESIEEEMRQPNSNSRLLDGLMEGLSHFEQSSVVVPIKTTVAERKAILGTIESELAATKADVSLIKDTVSDGTRASLDAFISERLESAADRLRSLTKVLAELALNIRTGNEVVA